MNRDERNYIIYLFDLSINEIKTLSRQSNLQYDQALVDEILFEIERMQLINLNESI